VTSAAFFVNMCHMETTSFTLLERLRHPGEEHAWMRFVDLYSPLLYTWARRTGLSEADAADLVQDVFALLVQKLPEFVYDRGKSFRAWLKTVLLNKYRENCRHAGKTVRGQNAPIDDLPAPEDGQAFWETEYREHLASRALEVMRAEFQPATWQAFWELVVVGRPGAEVAAQLGLSINAVYIARSRVLRRLRQELDGLMD